jgi:hypothetical protein
MLFILTKYKEICVSGHIVLKKILVLPTMPPDHTSVGHQTNKECSFLYY